MNFIKPLALSIFSLSLVYGADEKPKQPSFADEAYSKAVSENTKDCEKLYSDYINSLDVANKKIVKSLEATKKDLNDTSKNKSMTIADRADAIKAIDEKILAVKESGVGGAVQGRVVAKGTLIGGNAGLVIVSAKFGAGSKIIDITERVRALVSDNCLNTIAAGWGIPDPVPNVRKSTVIEYVLFGVSKSIAVYDNEDIKINVKK